MFRPRFVAPFQALDGNTHLSGPSPVASSRLPAVNYGTILVYCYLVHYITVIHPQRSHAQSLPNDSIEILPYMIPLKTMASRALWKAITTPDRLSRIVNVKSILALEIQRNSIDMVLISSLADQEDSVQVLDRLEWKDDQHTHHNHIPSSSTSTLPKRRIPDFILQELSDRIHQKHHHQQQHKEPETMISGMIVGWPIQGDTGKLGGPCGRVLYTLESLIQHDPTTISLHRPLCLWTRTTTVPSPLVFEEDAWGRCSAYGRTVAPSMNTHLASKEQYAFDDTLTATDLWQDFFKVHWPSLYRRRQTLKRQTKQGPLSFRSRVLPSSQPMDGRMAAGGGRRAPCPNNLVADWRAVPATYSEQVAV
jgi:hypothetical protein